MNGIFQLLITFVIIILCLNQYVMARRITHIHKSFEALLKLIQEKWEHEVRMQETIFGNYVEESIEKFRRDME
jgi:predicted Holliday junction resolvase-like endonuclease